MREFPLDYLFARGGFAEATFPDIYWPIGIAAAVFLVLTVVLYNVQTRRLHRHFVLANMWEWLLWTGLTVFSLLLVEWVFRFYFIFVLLTILIGIAAFLWVRFVRFPPLIDAYDAQLRRARFQSQQRLRTPEATVRRRPERSRRRRRR